ncbi:MAG TPA: transposase [Kutzneria sp.]|nr:transposase [Kutzneria sp.]
MEGTGALGRHRQSGSWSQRLRVTIFDQPDAAAVRDQYGRVVEAVQARFPDAATHLDEAREDLLTED